MKMTEHVSANMKRRVQLLLRSGTLVRRGFFDLGREELGERE
jgi:hypothetical protein